MNATTKETLDALERLLLAGKVLPKDALAVAYRVGHLDGALEMAKVGQEHVKALGDDIIKQASTVPS